MTARAAAWAFAALAALCGAAHAQAPAAEERPGYAKNEIPQLFSCVGLAAHAKSIVEQKQRGRSIEQVKKVYQDGNLAQVMLPVVEKAFGDPGAEPWKYAGGFFAYCAQGMAGVSHARVAPAMDCMFRSLIVLSAQQARDAGVPKEKAYTYLPPFGNPSHTLVDDVYARKDGTGQEYSAAWNWCISPFERQ